MEEQETYEIIIAIINEGFSDVLMNAARDNGARGGTITHARGTGTKEMEKKYGIVITPQKEMIYILVNSKIRDDVMTAINKVAGTDTNAQGLIFSLPVSDVSGLKFEQ